MRWIIYGMWLIVITNCTTKPDTIGIEDRFYRFNNDAYEKQIGKQGSYLKEIRNIQQAAKEEKQHFNTVENTRKFQKQAFLAELNQAEADVGLLTSSPKLAIHIKQIMEAITRLKQQAIIQPRIMSSHEKQMNSINELISEMREIAKNLK